MAPRNGFDGEQKTLYTKSGSRVCYCALRDGVIQDSAFLQVRPSSFSPGPDWNSSPEQPITRSKYLG